MLVIESLACYGCRPGAASFNVPCDTLVDWFQDADISGSKYASSAGD